MYISILVNNNGMMKNNRYISTTTTLFSAIVLTLLLGCERNFSEDVEFASFPQNGDVFIDTFSAGLDYFPFVDGGADPEAFSVDTKEFFAGNASIRFDVPPFGVGFVGATFNTTVKRDLSSFDALTFYAKASQAADINEIGFGIEGETGNKFQVTTQNLQISTRWEKYTIPIPDPSKLFNQTGLFWLAEGAENEFDEGGYTLWFDEIKFEKTGTLGQPRPAILNGADVLQPGFVNIGQSLTGLTQTVNLESGENITVIAAPSYFDFSSSNNGVAQVNEFGNISVTGLGRTTITASLANNAAEGSLELNVESAFEFAPTPPARASVDVISVFSDAYPNVAVDYFNGFFTPDGQTTQGGSPPLDFNGDRIINYTQLNFVGIGTFLNVSPINASAMTTLHVDIKVNEAIDPGDFIRIQLLNSVGNGETSGSVTLAASDLRQDEWVSFDIPLADFTGLGDRSQIGLLFFVSDSTISDIFVDNIYYYR
ncbi:carbohydrate-binding protein [Flagellimonas marinaquae]|uniref:carbohydrate-binding protein n=1 Tax=Flagellimonas marinaquae TaxID=254955 RepID=UPI001F494332|nr:carbohydrate-binding protein [Allomuricauda aquimarina]